MAWRGGGAGHVLRPQQASTRGAQPDLEQSAVQLSQLALPGTHLPWCPHRQPIAGRLSAVHGANNPAHGA